MPGQLTTYMHPITNPLNELHGHYTRMTTLHRDAHSQLLTHVRTLTTANGSDAFQGPAATAFATFVQQHIDKSDGHMQILDQVATALFICSNDITIAGIHVDMASVDECILEALLGNLDHAEVIQDGGDAVQRALQNLANDWERLKNDAHDVAESLIHLAGDAIRFTEDMVVLVGQTLVRVDSYIMEVLRQWGDAIKNAISACLQAIGQFLICMGSAIEIWVWNARESVLQWGDDKEQELKLGYTETQIAIGLMTDTQPSDKGPHKMPTKVKDITVADLYNDFYHSHKEKHSDKEVEVSDPIIIRTIGPNEILVTISGTILSNPNDPTSALNAFDVGAGNRYDPYILEVENAIKQYIKDHPQLSPNTKVVVAGHSLGGMVAEYLAEDSKRKTNGITFNVTHVITFGAGEVGSPVSGVRYDQFFYDGDPVPKLSKYEMSGRPTWEPYSNPNVHWHYIPDSTHAYSNPLKRHNAYGDHATNNMKILDMKILKSDANGNDVLKDTSMIQAKKEGTWVKTARLSVTLIRDIDGFVFPKFLPMFC